jgi:hypothetical protein
MKCDLAPYALAQLKMIFSSCLLACYIVFDDFSLKNFTLIMCYPSKKERKNRGEKMI